MVAAVAAGAIAATGLLVALGSASRGGGSLPINAAKEALEHAEGGQGDLAPSEGDVVAAIDRAKDRVLSSLPEADSAAAEAAAREVLGEGATIMATRPPVRVRGVTNVVFCIVGTQEMAKAVQNEDGSWTAWAFTNALGTGEASVYLGEYEQLKSSLPYDDAAGALMASWSGWDGVPAGLPCLLVDTIEEDEIGGVYCTIACYCEDGQDAVPTLAAADAHWDHGTGSWSFEPA